MADPQPIDAPPGVDPSVLAAMQSGFAAPGPQMQQRMYDAPSPMPDASMLPAPVAQAVQNGFAPQPPVGVVDGLGAPGAPQYAPPVFQPQPLADPFPAMAPTAVAGAAQGAAPSKADVAAAKTEVAAQASDAAKQAKAAAKQAAYDATPQGEDDAAVKAQLGVTTDQQAIVGQQGDLDAKAAAEEAALRDKSVADQAALLAKQDAARQEYFARQKQMIDERGKAVEEAAKRVPDPNRFYNSMSTAQHIGLGLMTILAGAGQGMSRDNGPNPVVKMMTDAQDKDIDAQKAGIEQGNKAIEAKRQLQQDYGHLGDEENAQWEYRKAQARTMLADQLEQAASHYKGPKAQLNAKMAADALRMDAAKIVGAQAERRLAQQNKDAELANTRTQLGIAGGHLALANKQFAFDKEKFGIETADKIIARKEAEQAKLDQIDEAAKVKAAAKAKAPEGGILGATGEPLLMRNGEPYTGIPKDMYKDVYEKDAAFKTATDAVDQLRQMREDDGGHINSHSSGARGAAQEMARLSLAVHKISGVRFTPEAMELANKVVTGSADADTVDSYIKTVEPQLDQFRKDLQHDHSFLPNFNGDPKQLEIPDPVKPKSAITESPDSKFLKKMEERAGGSTIADKAALNAPGRVEQALAAAAAVPSTGNVLADREARQKAYADVMASAPVAKPGEMTDTQSEFIKMAVNALNSGDATARATALKRMQQVAGDEATPHALRERAQEIVYKLRGYGKVTADTED